MAARCYPPSWTDEATFKAAQLECAFYSISDVAKLMGKVPQTIRNMCKKGALVGAKENKDGTFVINKKEFHAYYGD